MVRDNNEYNKNLNLDDLRKEKINEIIVKFTDHNGNFDYENFKNYIEENGEKVIREGYGLNFLGKRAAELLAGQESTTVFVPDIEHNEKEENKNSENIYISADNLDALRHLKHSYYKKIKCIYIDPPYNTGSDGFCYPDKFKYDKENDKETLSEKLGVSIDEAERILSMESNRTNSHSSWLSFMYARLLIAKELLTDDGAIFISIDDNEMANAKILLDDVLGENNYIGTFITKSTPNGRDYGNIAKQHEYVLMYVKDSYIYETNFIVDKKKKFKYKDNISDFNIHPLYNSNEKFNDKNRPNLYYPFYVFPEKKLDNIRIVNKDKKSNDEIEEENENEDVNVDSFYEIGLEKKKGSIEVYPPKSQKNSIQFVWRWGKELAFKNLNIEIVSYKDSNGNYRIVQKMRKGEKIIRSILEEKEFTTRRGTSELEKILGKKLFDFPKPKELIKVLIFSSMKEDAYIVDFFSGSASTANAVIELNKEYKLNLKYIMCQLSLDLDIELKEAKNDKKQMIKNQISLCDECGYPHTLDYIGIERIKRAADKIKEETSADIDYGFKHFTLVDRKETLSKLEEFNPGMPLLTQDEILKEYSVESRIITMLCEDGYGLTPKYEVLDLDGYKAYYIDKRLYLVEKDFDSKNIMALLKLMEKEDLVINKVVIFGYAFSTKELQQLKDNAEKIGIDDDKDIIIKY